jgi:hypothetical protein
LKKKRMRHPALLSIYGSETVPDALLNKCFHFNALNVSSQKGRPQRWLSITLASGRKARLPARLTLVSFAEFGYYLEVFESGGVAGDLAYGG